MDFDQALAFCEMLYGDEIVADEGLFIEIVNIPPKEDGKPKARARPSYTFYQTPRAAAEAAIKISEQGGNAYACMSMIDPKIKKGKRGTAKDAKAIPGFWCDIDIVSPDAPKNKNVPINLGEALSIAKGTGAAPSLIVHSGHGIHAYWLFDKPWVFQDDSERDYAADVVRNWHLTVLESARQHGRTLDSVFDLARILRVPGTMNTKVPSLPLPVTILWPKAVVTSG